MLLYEHPLSSHAQEVKIALREKGVPFELELPESFGTGRAKRRFLEDWLGGASASRIGSAARTSAGPMRRHRAWRVRQRFTRRAEDGANIAITGSNG